MLTPEDLQQIAAVVSTAKTETIEAMRDMQTEILRGIEAFARGNFARMHRLEEPQTPQPQSAWKPSNNGC